MVDVKLIKFHCGLKSFKKSNFLYLGTFKSSLTLHRNLVHNINNAITNIEIL